MKIVFVSLGFGKDDNLGGSVRVAATNAIALAKLGHEISYICTNRIDKKSKLFPGFKHEFKQGVNIYYLNTYNLSWWPGDFGPHLSIIPQKIQNIIFKAEIIHLNEYRSFLAFSISSLASFKKIPIIIQPHGTFLSHGNRVLLKNLFDFFFNIATKKSRKYFIASTSIEKTFFLKHGVLDDDISIIPNGIDKFDFNSHISGRFRAKFPDLKDDSLILSIGRLDKLKGFQFVIESLRFLPQNVKYLIIGPDQQNYVTELQLLIKNLQLENRVFFLGPMNNKAELYEAIVDSDIFIVPSIVEAFGMVILEASLAKKPIIISNNCSILHDLPSNLLLNVSLEPEKIANTISTLLINKELQIEISNNFYNYSSDNFTIESVANKIGNFYKEIKLKHK